MLFLLIKKIRTARHNIYPTHAMKITKVMQGIFVPDMFMDPKEIKYNNYDDIVLKIKEKGHSIYNLNIEFLPKPNMDKLDWIILSDGRFYDIPNDIVDVELDNEVNDFEPIDMKYKKNIEEEKQFNNRSKIYCFGYATRPNYYFLSTLTIKQEQDFKEKQKVVNDQRIYSIQTI